MMNPSTCASPSVSSQSGILEAPKQVKAPWTRRSLYTPRSCLCARMRAPAKGTQASWRASNGSELNLLLTILIERHEHSIHTWLLRERGQELRGIVRPEKPLKTVLSSRNLGRTMLHLRWSGHRPWNYLARCIYQERNKCRVSSKFSGHTLRTPH